MSAPSRPFAQLRLLIVDPQETSRALTTAALRRLGLRHVTQADGAASAAEVLRQAKLDLLLADWDQPPARNGDGLALTRFVRWDAEALDHRLPVVLLTAQPERARVRAARDAGVNAILRKPLSTMALYEHITGALADPRPFIDAPAFRGPERRRGVLAGYDGPRRRAADSDAVVLEDAG